jgi:hypothetical protein
LQHFLKIPIYKPGWSWIPIVSTGYQPDLAVWQNKKLGGGETINRDSTVGGVTAVAVTVEYLIDIVFIFVEIIVAPIIASEIYQSTHLPLNASRTGHFLPVLR